MENRYIIEQYKEIYKYAKNHPEDKAFTNEYNAQLLLYKKKQLPKVFRTPILFLPQSKYMRILKNLT